MLVALLAKIVEELYFRGLLLPRMPAVFGRGDWVANGALFTAYHLHEPRVMPTTLLTGVFTYAGLSREAVPEHLDLAHYPHAAELPDLAVNDG